ncbi:MAG: SCO family protein [Verrucomicrobiia bacterium]
MNRARPASPRLHRAAFIALGLIIAGFVGAYFHVSLRHVEGLREGEEALPVFGQVPDFRLKERSGREVTLADLRNQPWVVNLIFTSCPAACGMMTTRMREVQEALRKTPEIKLVSITVDPEHDTPEVLAAYAERFLAKPAQWWFLTGDAETIRRVAVEGLLMGFEETPPEERERLGRFTHSTRFALVDGEGRVRGYYDSGTPRVVDDVVLGIGRLLREARKGVE